MLFSFKSVAVLAAVPFLLLLQLFTQCVAAAVALDSLPQNQHQHYRRQLIQRPPELSPSQVRPQNPVGIFVDSKCEWLNITSGEYGLNITMIPSASYNASKPFVLMVRFNSTNNANTTVTATKEFLVGVYPNQVLSITPTALGSRQRLGPYYLNLQVSDIAKMGTERFTKYLTMPLGFDVVPAAGPNLAPPYQMKEGIDFRRTPAVPGIPHQPFGPFPGDVANPAPSTTPSPSTSATISWSSASNSATPKPSSSASSQRLPGSSSIRTTAASVNMVIFGLAAVFISLIFCL
ncbi:hypothetical protein GQ42DRAFT_157141 [Ramicandelaber brevisporus]|nr:hypothetical protein GQ42DRAFT_157141 [Ramicandelaber brevisporus]